MPCWPIRPRRTKRSLEPGERWPQLNVWLLEALTITLLVDDTPSQRRPTPVTVTPTPVTVTPEPSITPTEPSSDDHERFTDSQGNAAASKELSQRRADAVRELLVSRGVPADRVRAAGLGGVRPIADNGTVAGRAKNHRVEILVQAIVEAAGGPEGSRRVTPK